MPDLAASPGQLRLARVAFDVLGQRVDPVERQPQRLADVADRGAAAIGDDRRGQAGPLAAVFFVDVLQHLLAPLVLEVDVDVRRFVPLAADEPLEQQVAGRRVDRRDAQGEADGRVGRRAAALAQNVPRAGEADQVPDREKVRLVAQLADQLELVLDLLPDFRRQAGRVAFGRPLPGELREKLQRRLALGRQLGRIFVPQLVERETRSGRRFHRFAPRASGAAAKIARISSSGRRCRSALGNSNLPSAAATVVPWRIAVSTS